METVCNKTEGKVKSKMGRRCEEWFEEDGGDQLETKDAGEEAMERNNWASQNSQRVVELKEEEELILHIFKLIHIELDYLQLYNYRLGRNYGLTVLYNFTLQQLLQNVWDVILWIQLQYWIEIDQLMSLALLFQYLLLNMFRVLVNPSSGACDLLWIYFTCCIAVVRCVWCYGVVRLGWCGIVMQAEALLVWSGTDQ